MIVPCKGCADRCPEPNCHMTCERYLAYRDERDQIMKQKVLEKMVEQAVVDSTIRMTKYKSRAVRRRHER